MRDIVERLELQAFVADKIQSGMKPLIMDCLEEITHLRCQYEALLNQAEMNARLLTENASLRGEVETLRRDVKTAVMGDSAELQDVKRENERLRTELKESRRLFVRDTDEYIKWTDEAKVEIEKLRQAFKQAEDDMRPMLRSMISRSEAAEIVRRAAAAAIRESGDN